MKMACPATRVSQPSVFCSHYGMVIRIERAQEPVEKHRVIGNHVMLILESNAGIQNNVVASLDKNVNNGKAD